MGLNQGLINQKCNRKVIRSPAPSFSDWRCVFEKSEPILLTGSAGGIPPLGQKAEAERTISGFSNPALRYCEAVPLLATNFFIIFLISQFLVLFLQ